MFLTKTWLDEASLVCIFDSLQFSHHHGVSKITRRGGLALFWKKDFDLHIESSSQNQIDALTNKGRDNVRRFIGFYGVPKTHLRFESWDLLRSLHRQFAIPWLYAGNFNELLKSHEKLEGHLRPYGQMERFREALDECGLLDLGFVSNKFTWLKNYPNGGIVWERLDRAVSTAEWFDCFPITKVHTLACTSLDHNPISILLEGFIEKT